MKVYIAQQHYDYEGFTILMVCDTSEKAWAVCEADDAGDWHEVEEYEINECPWAKKGE